MYESKINNDGARGPTRARSYGTQTYGTQIPEVRARAAARGPARSMQPGHIEFGTGDWSLSVCFDGNRFRHMCLRKIPVKHTYRLEELTDLHLATESSWIRTHKLVHTALITHTNIHTITYKITLSLAAG
eukprot:COSAG02_NODE_2787_length_8027_cov_10.833375_1_plen_129_part_10